MPNLMLSSLLKHQPQLTSQLILLAVPSATVAPVSSPLPTQPPSPLPVRRAGPTTTVAVVEVEDVAATLITVHMITQTSPQEQVTILTRPASARSPKYPHGCPTPERKLKRTLRRRRRLPSTHRPYITRPPRTPRPLSRKLLPQAPPSPS